MTIYECDLYALQGMYLHTICVVFDGEPSIGMSSPENVSVTLTFALMTLKS